MVKQVASTDLDGVHEGFVSGVHPHHLLVDELFLARYLLIECRLFRFDPVELELKCVELFSACLGVALAAPAGLAQGFEPLGGVGVRERRGGEILRKMHASDDLTEIGIPQGGALSCFITNVVLDEADHAIDNLRKPDGPEIENLRYCDDMMILSPDPAACQEALTAYERVVARKKLPMHAPEEIYGRGSDSKSKSNYWNLKSKKPYLWSRAADSGIPCIQFVGYLIRHDGLVRIRPKSLKKHRQKLTDATDKLLSVINPGGKTKDGIPVFARGLRMTPHQIEHCFRMKLISMSVGRLTFWQPLPACGDDIMPMCWANGYRGLWQVPFDSSGLKELDRHRDRQLRRIRRCLSHLETPGGIPKVAGREKKKHRYYGNPFSYHGQFQRPANGCVRSRGYFLHWIHRPVEVLATESRRWLKRFMLSWNSLGSGCLKFFRRHHQSE